MKKIASLVAAGVAAAASAVVSSHGADGAQADRAQRREVGNWPRVAAALAADKQGALRDDLMDLLGCPNRAGPETLIVPSDYLAIVVTRK